VRNCYALSVTHFIRQPLRSYAVTHFVSDLICLVCVTSRSMIARFVICCGCRARNFVNQQLQCKDAQQKPDVSLA